MEFHEKIKFLREREGMTQAEMADLLSSRKKVWQNRMSLFENPPKSGNEVRVEPYLLLQIADFFGVSVRWLLDPALGRDDAGDRTEDRSRPGPEVGLEADHLTELERHILINVRMLGPHVALARLLGITPDRMHGGPAEGDDEPGPPPGPSGRGAVPTVKRDIVPRKKPGEHGGGGGRLRPPDSTTRSPRDRAREMWPQKKLPGSPDERGTGLKR